jgi:hypothetical protein
LVKGLGKIAIYPDHSISNVFLVDSLDYNLLSVSQLCKMGHNCLFTNIGVTVFRRSDDSITESSLCPGTGSGCRLEGGVNRRIKIITLKLKFLLYSKTRTQWSEEPFE